MNNSGYGIGIPDEEKPSEETYASMKEMLKKKCPYFDKMDEIFGHRADVNPLMLATEDERENHSEAEVQLSSNKDSSGPLSPEEFTSKNDTSGVLSTDRNQE